MPRIPIIAVLCALLTVAVTPALQAAPQEEEKVTLKVGDKAPDITLPKSEDEDAPKKLSDYKGKKNVVLAFYPKAFTGGCTTQLCGYRDDIEKFSSTDTVIVAISADEQDYSDKFKAEHKMPFTVLGDIKGDAIKKYGVGRELGNGGIMANRSIFVINKEGAISYIDLQYNISEDAKPLFEALEKLNTAKDS